jgi:hypothetical protein
MIQSRVEPIKSDMLNPSLIPLLLLQPEVVNTVSAFASDFFPVQNYLSAYFCCNST